MEEDTEYLKLPTEEQCVHKLWKARLKGYEAATKLFQQLDEKAPEFSRYAGLIKKFVTDSNAVAQDKGLDAALAFVENAHVAGRISGDVIGGVVLKAIAAPKTSTKEKARELILMVVEIEKFDVVQEELIKGFGQKNPKVVAGCINALTVVLSSFGHTVLNLKTLVKLIPDLLENKDKAIREETKALVVELHRWIGPAIKPQLSNLKPVLVSELEAEFEKSSGSKPQKTRFLRSQQQAQAKMAAAGDDGDEAGDDAEDDDGDEADVVDPLDLLEPVNVLTALPKDFHTLLESKKWQERKEALTSLLELVTKNPKVEPGDFGEIVKGLKRVIGKDSNVLVIVLAAQCMAGLARGLRKHYAPYAVASIGTVLEKFKEKKQNVVTALREAADAIFPATSVEAIQEEVFGCLNNKNPSVKSETASFLARSLCYCTPAVLTKKTLKAYVPELVKLLADSDPNVRDASSQALATAWRVVGEKVISPFISGIEGAKMDKIKEHLEKVELKVKVPAAKGGKSAVVKKPAAEPPVAAVKKPTAVRGGGGKRPATAGTKKSASSKSAASSEAAAPAVVTERELSDEEADQLVIELVSEATFKELTDSNWKTRLSATEAMLKTVGDRSDVPVQALLRVLSRKPGLKDNNFQVLRLKMRLVQNLAENAKFSSVSAQLCLADLVDKLPDSKTGSTAVDAITSIAEATSLEATAGDVMQLAFAHKSPKVQEQALLWLSRSLLEFGLAIKPKSVVNYARKALSHTGVAVRNAAVQLLGTMHLYMGAVLRTLFEDEKPAVLQLIDAEIERLAGESPPAPTRGLKSVTATSTAKGQPSAAVGSACSSSAVCSMEDLVPRVDISERITPALLAELNDKNWKIRSEALQSVADILRESRLVGPNTGELSSALAARCADSNKNLATEALRVLTTLAAALGPHAAAGHQLRAALPGMLVALGDGKPTVRQAATAALTGWSAAAGLRELLAPEEVQQQLRNGSPTARAELFAWLAEQLNQADPMAKSELPACLPFLYASLEDRSPDVRKAAGDCVLPFMVHLGYDVMARAAAKLKPASRTAVVAALDRERPNLPAPPAGPASRLPTSQSQESLDDDGGGASAGATKSAKGRGVAAGRGNAKQKPGARGIPSRTKKDEDVDTSPALQTNNLKKQRIQDEVKLRCLKWNFTTPRPEFLDQLKDQMTNANVNSTLMTQMFHADFKQHLKAIETLGVCVDTNMESVLANLDLLLKWLTLRLFDTNPTVIIRGLEVFHLIFQRLSADQYRMFEQEAIAFVPYLLVKLGDPKDAIRLSTRSIVRELYRVYPANKMFVFIMDGLKSKNGRQRAECLEEVGHLIENYALGVCQPSPGAALKEVARQIGDRDNSVRKAALNALVQAYYLCGDKLYRLVGNISDKDMSLLEERIKRAPPKPVAPASPRQHVQPSSTSSDSEIRSVRGGQHGGSPMRRRDEAHSQEEAEAEEGSGSESQQPRPSTEMTRFIDQLLVDMPRRQLPEVGPLLERCAKLDRQIDEMLEEPPMVLPSTKRSWAKPRISAYDQKELERYITQLADRDKTTARLALDRLTPVLKSDEPEVLADCVNPILLAACQQFVSILPVTASSKNVLDQMAPLLKDISSFIVQLMHYPVLADRCSKEAMKKLLNVLLQIMSSPDASKLGDLPTIANKVIVRLVDKANHTNTICCLVSMLEDSTRANNQTATDYQALLMKCLWKIVRSMEDWAAHDAMDLSEILVTTEQFFVAFPPSSWRAVASDTPLRTVRTVLHRLATIYGYMIMARMGRVPNALHSHTMVYLNKVLSTTGGKPSSALTGDKTGDSATGSSSSAAAGGPESGEADADRRRERSGEVGGEMADDSVTDPQTRQDQLKEIFRKLGSKESTKEAMGELYEFRQRHPAEDLRPFLDRTSPFFRNYIDRGLKAVELERQRAGLAAGPRAAPSIPAGQTRYRLLQKHMRRLDSQLPSMPSTDDENFNDKMASRLEAMLNLMSAKEVGGIEEIRQELQLMHSSGGDDAAGLHMSSTSSTSAATASTALVNMSTKSDTTSVGLTPSRQLGARGGGLNSSVPTATSHVTQQPSGAAASEIEEYRRRLAKLRRADNC